MAEQSEIHREEQGSRGRPVGGSRRRGQGQGRRRSVFALTGAVGLLAGLGATSISGASAGARVLSPQAVGVTEGSVAQVASGGPVAISHASVSGAVVTVSGRVSGAGASSVRLTLTGAVGTTRHHETFSAKLASGERFSIKHTTKLAATTALTVSAQEQTGTRAFGRAAVRAIKLPAPKVTLNAPKVSGQKITVSGRVSLTPDTAAERRLTRVALKLVEALTAKTSQTETFSTGVGASGRFSIVHTTKLTGALGFDTRALLAGKPAGKPLTSTIDVTGTSGTGGGPGTPLVGTFDLDPGTQAISGAISGSYFRMINPDGHTFFINNNSAASDPSYTLLGPGTDGGLSTAHFQEPPSPAFDTPYYQNGAIWTYVGNALANKIVQPVKFYGVNFSIVTDAVDQQSINFTTQTGNGDPGTPVADPLPVIDVHPDGTLSGQVTAWNAQWNGTSFNQGTPKPDGTTPGYTTKLSGTYDAATHRYELDWKSQITGKSSFNGFTGQWHLVGTFVPAS